MLGVVLELNILPVLLQEILGINDNAGLEKNQTQYYWIDTIQTPVFSARINFHAHGLPILSTVILYMVSSPRWDPEMVHL